MNKNSCFFFIDNSQKAYSFIQKRISFEQEEVWVICLSSNRKVLQYKKIFIGTVDSCMIHPREIFSFIITSKASSFLFFHSHPSGDPSPSNQDIRITKRLYKISQLFEIDMDDHIIASKFDYFSFADSRLEPFGRDNF